MQTLTDYARIRELVMALRAEIERDAITPYRLGEILRQMLDADDSDHGNLDSRLSALSGDVTALEKNLPKNQRTVDLSAIDFGIQDYERANAVARDSTCTRYVVTVKKVPMGILDMVSDAGCRVITQVLSTSHRLVDGVISDTPDAGHYYTYRRCFNIAASPSAVGAQRLEWSQWEIHHPEALDSLIAKVATIADITLPDLQAADTRLGNWPVGAVLPIAAVLSETPDVADLEVPDTATAVNVLALPHATGNDASVTGKSLFVVEAVVPVPGTDLTARRIYAAPSWLAAHGYDGATRFILGSTVYRVKNFHVLGSTYRKSLESLGQLVKLSYDDETQTLDITTA